MSDFQGWPDLETNYFRVPHQLMDIWSGIKSLAEERVILYVMRHTWGFHDKDKRITLDEFQLGRKRRDGTRLDGGTGLSKTAILRGIKAAVEHGFLVVEVDDSDLGRIRHTYSLRLAGEEDAEEDAAEDGPEDGQRYRSDTPEDAPEDAQGYRSDIPEVAKRYPGGIETLPRTENDTSEKDLRQQPPAEEAEEAAVPGDDVVVGSHSGKEEEARKPEVVSDGNRINTSAGADDLAQLWRDGIGEPVPLGDLRKWSKAHSAEWTALAIEEVAWRIEAARADTTGSTRPVDNPAGYVTNVLKRWSENGGPTPAPRVNRSAWKAEAEAAWELIERQMNRGGYQLVKSDPTLWAVIQKMGGWGRFRNEPRTQAPWTRKELDKHYQALATARQQQPA